MAARIVSWLKWSAAYFVVSLAIAFVAHGTDLDQLTSRSALSQAAAGVDRWLWAPYHWVGSRLAPEVVRMPGATPALLVANTLAWGAVLATLWRLLLRTRRHAHR